MAVALPPLAGLTEDGADCQVFKKSQAHGAILARCLAYLLHVRVLGERRIDL